MTTDVKSTDLKKTGPVTRKLQILKITALEILDPSEAGVELNEGYEFEVNGAIPQLADGIAKMLFEMDRDIESFGSDAGGAFLALIQQYYEMLKKGE